MQQSVLAGSQIKRRWAPDVARCIRPHEDEDFEDWLSRTREVFNPVSGATIPMGRLLDPEIKEWKSDPADEFRFVVALDLRAPTAHILQNLSWQVDIMREEMEQETRKRLQPPGPARPIDWVGFCTNGIPEVPGLRKTYTVYFLRNDENGRRRTNEELWDEAVAPYLREKGKNPDPDLEVKRADVSRHLRRAVAIMEGVRIGRFPFPERPRGKGLP